MCIDGDSSAMIIAKHDVPQGSVLSPLLYNLYVSKYIMITFWNLLCLYGVNPRGP